MVKIVYCSKTGFAKQYAEILSSETGYELIDVKNIDSIAKENQIVYIGSVLTGAIRGLKKVIKNYNFVAILAVGMVEGKDDHAASLKLQNSIENVPTFYAQGGNDLNKLKGFSKFMMKMILKSQAKKMSDDKAEQKRILNEELSYVSYVKTQNIEDLIALVKSI